MELTIDTDLLGMGLFNNFFCIIKRGMHTKNYLMVVEVGLKPTYNSLLLRYIVYRMIHFKKQFHILQLIPSDLLLTLSRSYVDLRLDASSISTIIK